VLYFKRMLHMAKAERSSDIRTNSQIKSLLKLTWIQSVY